MRADVYLRNLSDKMIAVGMTHIAPGETKKISDKDFERKASYVDRMIKERRLAFGSPEMINKVSAPAKAANEDISNSSAPVVGTAVTDSATAGEDTLTSDSETENKETQTSEADASDATKETVVADNATAGEDTAISDSETENTETQTSETSASAAIKETAKTEDTKEEADAKPALVEEVPAPTKK